MTRVPPMPAPRCTAFQTVLRVPVPGALLGLLLPGASSGAAAQQAPHPAAAAAVAPPAAADTLLGFGSAGPSSLHTAVFPSAAADSLPVLPLLGPWAYIDLDYRCGVRRAAGMAMAALLIWSVARRCSRRWGDASLLAEQRHKAQVGAAAAGWGSQGARGLCVVCASVCYCAV